MDDPGTLIELAAAGRAGGYSARGRSLLIGHRATTSRSVLRFTSAMACAAIALGSGAPAARAEVIDFETVPPGTVFGTPSADQPGDVVLQQGGVNMSIEQFFLGSYTGFVRAIVGGPYDQFFPTTPLGLENIAVRFDFAGMPGFVTSFTLDYQEFGGSNNFAVNDFINFEIDDLSDLPANVAPGVTATITPNQVILTGFIQNVRIGGQELAIDNANVVPEPATLLLLVSGGALLGARRARRL